MLFKPFYLFTFLIISSSLKLSANAEQIKKGEYIFQASGGCSCHTNKINQGGFLAGGRSIKTPFGTFFSTNITPDIETGIGNWSDEDFIRAMKLGISPAGEHYFPVFPYTSFQLIKKNDLLALKAYIFSIPPINQKNTPNKLILPIGRKIPMMFWKKFVWSAKQFQENPLKTKNWNRGSYLIQAISHCTECHTPRNFLGKLNKKMHLAGSIDGPEGELAPNITPDLKTGIGGWTKVDISYFLKTGIKPDGDYTEGLMSEVIDKGYQNLVDEDLNAIAEYLLTIPPIENNLSNKNNSP